MSSIKAHIAPTIINYILMPPVSRRNFRCDVRVAILFDLEVLTKDQLGAAYQSNACTCFILFKVTPESPTTICFSAESLTREEKTIQASRVRFCGFFSPKVCVEVDHNGGNRATDQPNMRLTTTLLLSAELLVDVGVPNGFNVNDKESSELKIRLRI